MDWLNISPETGLWGFALSSFLGATLLPGGSEAVLYGLLKLHPETAWPALWLGTLANTAGGMSVRKFISAPGRSGNSKR